MLYCRSVSHQTAPLGIREQLDFTNEQLTTWLVERSPKDVVVLSTCNRLELYTTRHEIDDLWGSLLAAKNLTPAALEHYTVKAANLEATHHLFQVASSLRSMALGEAQILGQVSAALDLAHRCGTADHQLSMLFRAAIHAAKRVHTETAISMGNVSVSSLGISKLEQLFGDLSQKAILVIGAGEMGQAVVKALDRRHLPNVTLVSRTFETAKQVADNWGIKAAPITHLKELLTQVDILLTTSSAPFPILSAEDIEPIMEIRLRRELYVVDIAVPRDVAPEVDNIPGVQLFDLDDLQKVVDKNYHERELAVPHAHQILEEELTQFWCEYQGLSVVPTIRQLREHIDEIRQAELERIYRKLENADAENLNALFEEFSHRFMNKMLHQPTRNLKAKAGNGNGALLTSVARELFGLE